MKNKKIYFYQINKLFKHLKINRKYQLLFVFFIMILASFAELISLGSIFPFLGVLLSPEKIWNYEIIQYFVPILGIRVPNELAFYITLLFCMAAIFAGIIRLTLLHFQIKLGHAIGSDISIKVFDSVLSQPYQNHLNQNTSEIIAAVTSKTNSVVYQTILPHLVILNCLTTIIIILIGASYIAPYITLISLLSFGTIYLFIVFFVKRNLLNYGDKVSTEQTKVVKALQEGLGGIRHVIIDNLKKIYVKLYRDSDIPLRSSIASVEIISGSPRFYVEALGMTLIALMTYQLSKSSDGIIDIIPLLGALALTAQRLLPAVQNIYSSVSSILSGVVSLKDVLDLLDQEQIKETISSREEIQFNNRIEFDKISFKYGKEEKFIFKNLSFYISKGQNISIVGPTGSGKSTLLDIIMGLVKPSTGSIIIDGIKINESNIKSWQTKIAHVPQTTFLTDSTVLENIAFGVESRNIDIEKVKIAAKKAKLDSLINSWPEKFNTKVGERGVKISGGQRQRIAIARALYKSADVIIFDEATNALDIKTENQVNENIQALSKDLTIIIVTHRMNNNIKYDQIINLNRLETNEIE
ncbi:ABC transporter ATP-binding protein/permease [Alphaproteobacteria bacterium]|nr:ABC transporter ATP-binding protein/permease [Alphaproteobacteria bacterium]